jgi:hypothetical protein
MCGACGIDVKSSFGSKGSQGENVMENALIVPEQPALPAELTATLDLAADFASKAKATQEAYASDFRSLTCEAAPAE